MASTTATERDQRHLLRAIELAATARGQGVAVHPLSWHRTRPGPPGLVIGYAATTPDRLREAVRRLAPLAH